MMTEEATPLQEVMESTTPPSEHLVSWGIHQIIVRHCIIIFSFKTPCHFLMNHVRMANFLSNFNKFIKNPILIAISSNFLCNISTCICIRKCNKKEEISSSDF